MSNYQLEALKQGDTVAILKTNLGDIKFKLFPDEAPKTVENFTTHIKDGYYNGIIFHRVIKDFMIQGGDPTGTGMGGESIYGRPFEDECTPVLRNYRGALSMANAGPCTNGSQFFVVQCDNVPDGLVSQMGGPQVAALGFGMGIERLMLALQNQNADFPEADKCDIYIAPMGDAAAIKATALCTALRRDGFEAQCDVCGRGLKAQMKYADKIGALYSIVLGDTELAENKANIKNMQTGDIKEVNLDNFSEQFMQIKLDDAFASLEESVL